MKSLISLLILSACSSVPSQLSQKASELEVFDTKPVGCKVMGKVTGTDKIGSRELALNHALNQAADLNASGIFVNQEVPNGRAVNVYATAYRCD